MREWLRFIKPAAPLHPIFVHFTIALTSFSVICDLTGLYFHSESLSSTGWWALATSAIITLFTIVSGFISRTRVAMEESTALAFLRMHMALGPIFYGLLLIMTVWRASVWQAKNGLSGWYLLYAAVVLLVMLIQGYLGGELVYRFGAEVKRIYPALPVNQDDQYGNFP
jgi:uncharacterized membrane protein